MMYSLIRSVLRMYRINLRLDWRSLVAYPGTFWIAITTIPLWSLIQIVFIETIYGQVESFLGYSRFENYVLFGTYKIVQSLAVTLFMINLEELTGRIRGTDMWSLDMMLLKPVDSQVFATMGRIWFGSLAALGVGMGMVVYGLVNEPQTITLLNTVFYLIAIGVGMLLFYVIYLFIQTWLFWFEYLQVGETLWFTIQDLGQYPRNLYRGWLGILLNIVFPLTVAAAVPVDILLGRGSGWGLLAATISVAILFLLTRSFWKYSIKKYASVSS